VFTEICADMEPLSLSIALSAAAHAVVSKIDWSALSENLVKQGASGAGKGLLARVKAEKERIELARAAVSLYVEQFTKELETTTILEAALPEYLNQLGRFVVICAAELTDALLPDAQELNSRLLSRTWDEMGLDSLPGFDWDLVGKNFLRELRKLVRKTPSLRDQLSIVLQEQQLEATKEVVAAVRDLKPAEMPIDLDGYRKFVMDMCSTLHLAIMHSSTYNYSKNLNLWSVFIPPSAREAIPVPDLPIVTLARLREEGYVSDVPSEYELAAMRQAYESSSSGPVLEALKRQSKAVLMGDPGAGKSSLLKYLALEWVFGESDLIPLLVDLREYLQDRSQFIRFVASRTQTFGFTSIAIHELLQSGRAALYLDGLDEVLDRATRAATTESIVAFSARYPKARIVVTSRIAGYDPELLRTAGFAHLTLENLGKSEIASFLQRWYELAEDDPTTRSRNSARLMRAIETSRPIRELAGNPLLLTMMAILNRNQDLPRDRVELYREAARVLLHELDASRLLNIDTFARQEKEELLRALAGRMQEMPEGLTANSVSRKELLQLIIRLLTKYGVVNPYAKGNALLEQLTDRNFVLCPTGAGRFAFVHRTFLEYFCASWIIEKFQVDQTMSFDTLRDSIFGLRWQDESWHEVLRLIAGMVGDRQANELIRYLIELPGRAKQYANLMLAAGCLSELRNRRVVQETDTALKSLIIEKAIRYDAPYYYEVYSEWLEVGPIRHRAVRLLYPVWPTEETEIWLKTAAETDRDWIIRQVAIQEYSRTPDRDGTRRAWLKQRFDEEGKAAVRRSALQEYAFHGRSEPSTLQYLISIAETDRHTTVRQGAIQEIARGWRDSEQVLPFLKLRAEEDPELFARQAALQEIARGWKDSPDTVTWLKAHAENDHPAQLQFSAVQEYSRGWAANGGMHEWLLERTTNGVSMARQAALQELAQAWKRHQGTFALIFRMAEQDEDQEVRRTCIRLLLVGWSEDQGVYTFIQQRCRNDESRIVKVTGIQQLSRLGTRSEEVLSFLKDYAASEAAPSPRRAAILEVARGWGHLPETITWLKSLVYGNGPTNVRGGALLALARLGLEQDETLQLLLGVARNPEAGLLQKIAVGELSRNWKGSFDFVGLLTELATTASLYQVRAACVEELANIEPWQERVRSLIERIAFNDPHTSVRRVAFAQLFQEAQDDASRVRVLLDSARKDPNRKLRKNVVNWLKQHPLLGIRYRDLLEGVTDL